MKVYRKEIKDCRECPDCVHNGKWCQARQEVRQEMEKQFIFERCWICGSLLQEGVCEKCPKRQLLAVAWLIIGGALMVALMYFVSAWFIVIAPALVFPLTWAFGLGEFD